MGVLGEYANNDEISLTVKVCAIPYTGTKYLDYRLQVLTGDSHKVILQVWEWSPASEIDWQVGKWYHLQDVVVKHWSDSIELDANRQTQAEPIEPPRVEKNEFQSAAVTTTPPDVCGFTWPDDYAGDGAVSEAPSNCCYRETWHDYDRCIWHAETNAEKPTEELKAQRETPENRKLNERPRELLTGVSLRGAEITDIVLTRADLSGADLTGTNFTDVYLGYANLSSADLHDADLRDSIVSRATFAHANLERANLRSTSLFGADFTNADLCNADLSNSTLRNTDFTNAILDGTHLDDDDHAQTDHADTELNEDASSANSDNNDSPTTSTDELTTTPSTASQTFSSDQSLESVPGIGNVRATALRRAGFTCVDDVASASVSELGQINKITRGTARAIQEAAKQLRGDGDTLASKLADELDVSEEDVRSAYAELAPIKVSPSKAERPLRIAFCGDDISVLHLDVYSLRSRYLLWANGYESIEDVAQASLSELTKVKYIRESQAKKFQQAAEAAISDSPSDDGGTTSEADSSDPKPLSNDDTEISARKTTSKDSPSQNAATPPASTRPTMRFDGGALSNLLETFVSKYGRVFSAAHPQADWRKIFARRYSSKVDRVISDTSPLTADEIQQLLRPFLDSGNSTESVLSRLDGPLSHPKWKTLMTFVETNPEAASEAFTFLFQPNRPVAERIDKFMEHISADAFNAVGSKCEKGTKSISPSPLLGIPTTILMFAFPEDHISYQYRPYKRFFESYSDYQVKTASSTNLVSQYVDLCNGAQEINRQLGRFLDSPTMIDVRNIIRHHEELENLSPRDAFQTDDRTNGASPVAQTADTKNNQPTPNQLSEYYEAFRCVRNAIEAVAVFEESYIRPDDQAQPAIQYYRLIHAILEAESLLPEEFIGYSPQQVNRISCGITNYRQTFGNGSWVTDYQEISVEPFRKESRHFLTEHQLIESPDALVRPVSPMTSTPVPEIVETKAELRAAMDVLAQFPAYPATPECPTPSDKRIPVDALYERISTDIDDGDTVDVPMDRAIQSNDEPLQASPVAEATPTTRAGITQFLSDYEKLTHLFRRIEPPSDVAASLAIPVFGLDWYKPTSRVGEPNAHSLRLLSFAKKDEATNVEHFRTRVRDLIHRRFLHDIWEYDYITVFPSHEAGRLSPPLVELAKDVVLKTPIVYAPLLERTEKAPRQREQTHDERLEIARTPEATLQTRSQLRDDTVILLDDICTSGASMMAGANLLRAAGAKRVIGLALGMTVGNDAHVQEISSPSASVSEIIAMGDR